MLVAPVKANARTPKESRNTSSQYVRDKDYYDQGKQDPKSILCFGQRERWGAVRDLQSAQYRSADQHSRDDERYTNECPLTPARTANDFRAATATDHRTVGHRCLAVRAQEQVHGTSIGASLRRTNQFLLCRIRRPHLCARCAGRGERSVDYSSGCGLVSLLFGHFVMDRGAHLWRLRRK
jgi:hypothetical protein